MLKQTISYTDFDDKQQTETLYFNLSRTEMMEMLDFQPRLQAWEDRRIQSPTDLTPDVILELFGIVKDLIERSYGERSEDGKHFRKSAEIFANFKSSAVYDAFLFQMFEDPEKAVNFMVGILPKDIAEQTTKQLQEVQLPDNTLTAVDQEVPAYIRENREPTSTELQNMTPAELAAAWQRKNQS